MPLGPCARAFEKVAFVGVLAALALLPLVYDRAARDAYTLPKRAAIQTAVCCLATVACAARLRAGLRLHRSWAFVLLLAACGFLSACGAPSASQAVERLRDLALIALPAAFVGAVLVTTPRRMLWCADALRVAGFLVAAVGIAQHQGLDWWGFRPDVAATRGSNPAPSPDLLAMPLIGGVIEALYEGLHRLSQPDGWFPGRPFARLPTQDGPASVFGHPNVAAEVVAAGLAAIVVSAGAAWGRARTAAARVIACGPLALRACVAVVMALYVAITGTRGAWVGLGVATALCCAVFVASSPRGGRARRLVGVLLTVAALGAAGAAVASRIQVAGRGGGPPETVLDRVASVLRPSDPARDTVYERRVLWANTHAMLDPKHDGGLPSALGVGPGNWQVAYPLHHRSAMEHVAGTYRLNRYADHAHQDPLEFLAEFGVAGVALLCVFMGAVVGALRACFRADGAARAAALAIVVVLTTLLTMSLFSFPLHLPSPLLITSLLVGAAFGLTPAHEGAAGRVVGAGLLFAAVVALGGARAGAGFAAALALVAGVAARLIPGATWLIRIACATAFAVLVASWAWLRDQVGGFEAVVAVCGSLVVLASAGRGGEPVLARGGAVRALAGAGMLLITIAALGGWSRVRASEDHQRGLDLAWAARFVPGSRAFGETQARDALDRSTVRNPCNFAAELVRADLLTRTGDLGEAEGAARRALGLHPWLINARVQLADVRLRLGDEDGAMREARSARALNPDAPEPHRAMGELFLRQGRVDFAMEALEKSIELSPGRYAPYAKLRAASIALREGRDLGKALRWLEEAQVEGSGDARLLSGVASLYSAPGAPPEFRTKAEGLWARVLALAPEDPRARLHAAATPLLLRDPDQDEVERILATIDSIARDYPGFEPGSVRIFRATALWKLGRTEEALRSAREAMLLSVAPFRTRDDDALLQAAIEAMQSLQSESRGSESR